MKHVKHAKALLKVIMKYQDATFVDSEEDDASDNTEQDQETPPRQDDQKTENLGAHSS